MEDKLYSMWTLKKVAMIISPISFLSGFVEETLKAYFNHVILFSSICESLNYMKKNEKPDLIIGSYILKDGDLFDFIEACRLQDIKLPPVLLITSQEDETLLKKALQVGVTEVVNKSVLKEKLRDFLFDFVFSIDLKKLRGTVMCIEDSSVYSDFIKKSFGETELNLIIYDNGKEAIDYLKVHDIDMLIVDFLLKGDYSGLDIIRIVRREPRLRFVPIIVMTGFDDFNRRLELFKAGADDYMLKPFTSIELLVKVRNHFEKYTAVKALKRQLEDLQKLYLRDPLTGAYNRNVLEFVEKEIYNSKRYGKPFSLILFDFDDFKLINDSYGHTVGDRVLVEFSRTVSSMMRKTDYLIRFGGEEFLIAMPGANISSAIKKAEDIRRAIESLDIDGLHVTLSAGVASLPEKGNAELQDLIEMVDRAMYMAKRAGKNRVEAYNNKTSGD